MMNFMSYMAIVTSLAAFAAMMYLAVVDTNCSEAAKEYSRFKTAEWEGTIKGLGPNCTFREVKEWVDALPN
jgi:hypothetical protein